MLIDAGLHVPLIPFVDETGSIGAMLFWHNEPMAVKTGVTCVSTVISIVTVAVAHCPVAGVKV